MDELLADDPGFGLNIVVSQPTTTTTTNNNKSTSNSSSLSEKRKKFKTKDLPEKKKKYNKYEKRRYKAKLAKEEGLTPQQKHHQILEENRKRQEEQEEDQKQSLNELNEKDDTVHMDDNDDEIQPSSPSTPTTPSMPSPALQEADGGEDNVNINESADAETSDIVIDPNRKASRRYHIQNELDAEEKRAAYMAEFHAHPMEMDRKNNAESNIKLSTSSSHIFSTTATSISTSISTSTINAIQEETLETTKNELSKQNHDDDDDEDDDCPFVSIGIHKRIAQAITNPKGPFALHQPTIIQARAMSLLLPSLKPKTPIHQKQNVFVQSETGSGKTLAYLMPLLHQIMLSNSTHSNSKNRLDQNFTTLILLPTRELALQTYQTALQLTLHTKQCNVTPICLSGGEKRKSEKARLRKGFTMLIGTPGRILDHLQKTECLRSSLSLITTEETSKKAPNPEHALQWLVLDEADRLLDMGLGGQIKSILSIIQDLCGDLFVRRGYGLRSILVSATVTEDMQTLAKGMLEDTNNTALSKSKNKKDWIWVSATKLENKQNEIKTTHTNNNNDISSSNEGTNDNVNSNNNNNPLPLEHAAPRQLAQQHMIVSAKLRLPALVAFLLARVKEQQRVVVFMATCDGVDYHYHLFKQMESFMPEDRDNDKNTDISGLFGKQCELFRLHGNIPHSERNQIVQQFTQTKFGFSSSSVSSSSSKHKSHILFATDVAARGLNLPGVDWIVQHDPPCETSDYIHRAGRTARAGNAGNALLFLLPSERAYMDILDVKGLKGVNTALSLTSTLERAAKMCPHITQEGERKSGGGSRIGEAFAMATQIQLEQCVVEDTQSRKQVMKQLQKDTKKKKKKEGRHSMDKIKQQELNSLENGLQAMARKAFTSFLRAYPTKEKAVRHIFSTRALHLGHVARSFALKDPPKALRTGGAGAGVNAGAGASAGKKQDGKYGNDTDFKAEKKRNANLAFEGSSHIRFDGANETGKKRPPKRSKTPILKGKFSGSDRDFDVTSNGKKESTDVIRSKMMLAAKKLQSGGMEFF